MNLIPYKHLLKAVLLLLGLVTGGGLIAQVTANFQADKLSGCAPLVVSFSNQSTGLSDKALYQWDFGNGNQAILKDPKAAFTVPGTYTVTLTVTDEGKVATTTRQITVYKSPTVDFELDVVKGCAPLAVGFKAKATPGDGDLSSFFWDFGDGHTASSSDPQIQHVYTADGIPAISLTATNSFGCQQHLLKEKLVEILPELVAAFTPDKTALCKITDAVQFRNDSKGAGSLSYLWEFGDGQQSTAHNPGHIYSKPGQYTTKLTVKNNDGCSVIYSQPTPINVANFTVDFDLLSAPCENTPLEWENKSSPVPDETTWSFGDGSVVSQTPDQHVWHSYYQPMKYAVTLTSRFGDCIIPVTKNIDIRPLPKLDGYLIAVDKPCESPVIVKFTDTSKTAVKWEWYTGDNILQEAGKSLLHTYPINAFYNTSLKITDHYGCAVWTYKDLDLRKPQLKIEYLNASSPDYNQSCGPLTITFKATGNEIVTKYEWDFGDGTKSNEASPTHTYSKAGQYRPVLNFINDKGCAGHAEYEGYWTVRMPVKADFSVSSTEICGNTPVQFTNTSTGLTDPAYYYWDFGDGEKDQLYYQTDFYHKYEREGYFTVRLIATDLVCSDTMIKTNYLHVNPPFPKISGYTNTCEGTRGLVTFTENSRQTDSWTWDFGDGSSFSTTTAQPTVDHLYTKTGWYMTRLTTTRGNCTVKDSIYLKVYLKQKVTLATDQTEICAHSDFLKFTVTMKEQNPATRSDEFGYWFRKYEYPDGTEPTYSGLGNNGMPYVSQETGTLIEFNTASLDIGQTGFRLICQSREFNCIDTTNYIMVKLQGPLLKLETVPEDLCKGSNTVIIKNLSSNTGTAQNTKWEWFWSDGPIDVQDNKPQFSHTYNWPGQYQPSVRVTDSKGCEAVGHVDANVFTNGLKAKIYASTSVISPGSSVVFTNGSTTMDESHTTYKWLFHDGQVLTSTDAQKLYSQPGDYLVRLVALNTLSGCTDTASITIKVKLVNAVFAFSSSFIANSTCPPVLVNFSNTSSNIKSIVWDFGDGTVVKDLMNPSHVYTEPGFYLIRVDTYSDNGTKYTTLDSIRIKGMEADLKPDRDYGCAPLSVAFQSAASNIISYAWDFGDGNLVQTSDGAISHNYQNSGIYQPVLVVTNDQGCAAAVKTAKPVVIDALDVDMGQVPAMICTPREIQFRPSINSISGAQDPASITYQWNFGAPSAGSTSAEEQPKFTYTQPGKYTVSLKVQTNTGCAQQVTKNIQAFEGIGAGIDAPSEICAGQPVRFAGKTILPGNPAWKWIFDDGSSVSTQYPPERKYVQPGLHTTLLVVDNGGCIDSISHTLQVNTIPKVTVTASAEKICEGQTVTLTAGGAYQYNWKPSDGLVTITGTAVEANPSVDSKYVVMGTDEHGCSAGDSLTIAVVHPHRVSLDPNQKVCAGTEVQLHASGAVDYRWIENTDGLSSTTTANPFANPAADIIYTVVGTGEMHCFADTATVEVKVTPLPEINAGPDLTLQAGVAYQFPVEAGSDVISFQWSPPDFLSCVTCQSPEAKPWKNMQYIVTVANSGGCIASDTVIMKFSCADSKLFIPNAFTPNGDGRNDRFNIKAKGINLINRLQIYNRFGQLVFERKDFYPDDEKGAWDGRMQGQQVPAGTYVYFIEASCMEDRITRKGTIIVAY